MLMLHEAVKRLEYIFHLRKDWTLMALLGFQSIPCTSTLDNWLPAFGRCRPSRNALQEINRQLLQVGLRPCDHVTLDMKATAIHTKRKMVRHTYKKRWGFMSMAGHIVETVQVAHN